MHLRLKCEVSILIIPECQGQKPKKPVIRPSVYFTVLLSSGTQLPEDLLPFQAIYFGSKIFILLSQSQLDLTHHHDQLITIKMHPFF